MSALTPRRRPAPDGLPASPGSARLTLLRERAAGARRSALLTLGISTTLLVTVQLLAERADTGRAAAPYAVAALVLFAVTLPALTASQVLWGIREQEARSGEREVFATRSRPDTRRLLTRLAVAACWAVVVLLGLTLPRLFTDAGLYGAADRLGSAAETLAMTCYMGGMAFLLWWGRDVIVAAARRQPPPDPWNDAAPSRPRARRLPSTAAITLALALISARAHLWAPHTVTVLALAAVALAACVVAVLGAPSRTPRSQE
ncbi:hypothetical protein [Microtetraspora sp. NBRC 16547]|uniref:hypothetical protein n=1 Tax=Microtetraspora sp. NBRC 16547 TaxID=3030993 RepID=UPI0024A4A9C3|nr:hypothetical protein [Microtetraspora sp. NBRC 16547]GLW96629.1 hypothetical protein Misp02_07160 [Microtetraspora sp. NBRC 16547]